MKRSISESSSSGYSGVPVDILEVLDVGKMDGYFPLFKPALLPM
jgi:hypothetical protein